MPVIGWLVKVLFQNDGAPLSSHASGAPGVVSQAESQRAEDAWERQTRDPFLETFLFEVSLASQE